MCIVLGTIELISVVRVKKNQIKPNTEQVNAQFCEE